MMVNRVSKELQILGLFDLSMGGVHKARESGLPGYKILDVGA